MPDRYRFASGAPRAALLAAILLSVLPASADVVVTVDTETLNRILPEVSRQQVSVPVTNRTLTVSLKDLRITGFIPTAGAEQPGAILAALTVEVPELNTSLPVQPRISLHVGSGEASGQLELRFEELALPLPLMRPVNVAGLVPPLTFPTDSIFVVDGAAGEVHVRSELREVRVESDGLRFTFSVNVVP